MNDDSPRWSGPREIVLDTETTGLDPGTGHRIVEIACLELVNHVPTGRLFHRYVNPERDMPDDAYAVHGLSAEFLAEHPRFELIIEDLLAFIGDSALVIHNAEFDLRFLEHELKRAGRPALAGAHIDTLALARKRYPGAPASLDALCRRFEVDLSEREKHGARLDSELLARVYLELIGGRQPGLEFVVTSAGLVAAPVERLTRPPRPHAPSPEELAAHQAFLAKLAAPLWLA